MVASWHRERHLQRNMHPKIRSAKGGEGRFFYRCGAPSCEGLKLHAFFEKSNGWGIVLFCASQTAHGVVRGGVSRRGPVDALPRETFRGERFTVRRVLTREALRPARRRSSSYPARLLDALVVPRSRAPSRWSCTPRTPHAPPMGRPMRAPTHWMCLRLRRVQARSHGPFERYSCSSLSG